MPLTISEPARSADVGVETVRFYQHKGLLFDPKPASRVGSASRRHYGEEEVRQLCFIRSAQRAGFTLEEIGKLLELDQSEDRGRVRSMAQPRIAVLDDRIDQLRQARCALEALAQQCALNDEGPCPIISAFEKARKS